MVVKERIFLILRKKSIQDVSLVYLGSLLNGVSIFLINIFLGRILEKSLFGIFSLSVMVLSTVAEMSDFGLNAGLLRFAPYYLMSREYEKLKQLVKTIWRWRISLSVVLTFGGVIMSPFLATYLFNNSAVYPYLVFSFLGIGGVILVGFTSAYLQASQNFLINSVVQSLKGLLRLLFVFFLYIIGVRDLFAYLFVYLAIPWILFIFTYKYLPKGFRLTQVEIEIKQKINSQLSKFSFWLTIWSFSAILSSRIDQVMVSHFLGLESVAVYGMAFQFVYIYTLAAQSITAVLIPKFSALKNNNEILFFLKKIVKYVSLAVFILGVLVFISQYVIGFIFGYKYIESTPIYIVLSYATLLGFFGIPASLIITTFNRTRLVAYSGFLQLVINFLLNFLLVPRFGVVGAAYTFGVGIICSLVYNLSCAIYLMKRRILEVV